NPAVLVMSNPAQPANIVFPNNQDTTFTLTNLGGSSASGIALSGVFAPHSRVGGTCGAVLNPSMSCTIVIRFSSPGQITANGTMRIDYNDSVASQNLNRALLATGVSRSVSLGTNPGDFAYPSNGSKWNDYIKNNNGGTNIFNQPDLSCTGAESGGPFTCIHGGEKKKYTVTGVSSCSGLTIEDSLGVFDWVCDASTGTAVFYTAKLKEGKGLKDLIDGTTGTSFKNNSITIYQENIKAAVSTPAVWWTNSVSNLPDNRLATDPFAVLATVGEIYTLLSSRASSGYNINADRIALVNLNGALLSYSGNVATNYDRATGEPAATNDYAIVASGGQKFIWLEGDFDSFGGGGQDAVDGIAMISTRLSRFNLISNKNANCHGLEFAGSLYNLLTGIKLSNGGTCNVGGLRFENSTGNTLIGATLNNNRSSGLALDLSSQNILVGVNASNNGNGTADGINFVNSDSNILVGATVANGSNTDIRINSASSRNTASHVIVANSRDESFTIESLGTNFNTINQVLRANGGVSWGGVYLANGSTNTIVSQILSASSNGYGVELEDSSFNH
ncbi:MAG: hypothetical protein AABZ55_08995, partial [Bdellovibrionota bacterium]